MSNDVHVYIDVDGVINAVNCRQPQWGWDRIDPAVQIDGFSILAAPELVERINAIADLPWTRMHWLTTWEERAAESLSPHIGLRGEDWSVVGAEVHYSKELAGRWWKLQALQNHLPEGVAAIWIDDDIAFDIEAREWLERTPSVRWISPRTETGLTKKQMRQVDGWAGTAHHSPDHDPLRDGRCVCGTRLTAPTREAHDAHVAEAVGA